MTGILEAIVTFWNGSALNASAGPLWRDLAKEGAMMPYTTFSIPDGGPWDRTFEAVHLEAPEFMFRTFIVGDAQAQAQADALAHAFNGTTLTINSALNDGYCYCGAEVVCPPISRRKDVNETSDDVWVGIVRVRFPLLQAY